MTIVTSPSCPPFPKDEIPLDEWHRGAVHFPPWMGLLSRRVRTIPATLAGPRHLFSTAGNAMTKKRSHLTCDSMEEFVYPKRCGCGCGSGRR